MITTRETLLVLKKLLNYFTIWVLIISTLYHLGEFQAYYLDLVFLHIFISALTIYIVYVEPREFTLNIGNKKIVLFGNKLRIIDIIIHHIPLILLLWRGGVYKKNYLFFILPIFYRLTHNPMKIYGVKDIVGMIFYLITLLIYLVI
tara:strand:- start:445 stop:882 length:438 start_codon:yes stop_codon:yes gene_type:complete